MLRPDATNTAKRFHDLLTATRNDMSRVISEWQTIVEYHPTVVVLLFYLGLSLEAAGTTNEAIRIYTQSLITKPEFTEAKERLHLLKNR